jgi:hypothetical protein
VNRPTGLAPLFVAGLVGLALAGPARALIVAPPPPLSDRLAQADCVVVARVVGMESQDVAALRFAKATQKTRYRIALLKVTEVIKGTRSTMELRVGFVAPPPARPSGGLIRPAGPRFGNTFSIGQEGIFYLTRHFQEPFFLAPRYYDFVAARNANFQQELELTRYAAKVGDKLSAGLEARNAKERFFAAALLIQQYRTFRGGTGKVEPLDSKQSRLILTALAEADWSIDGQVSPWNLFQQLGLKKEDGWEFRPASPPPGGYQQAARAWLREHANTYRIQRIVGPEPTASGRRP